MDVSSILCFLLHVEWLQSIFYYLKVEVISFTWGVSFPFLSSSLMRRLAQVYKSHRKTERPRTPQPFALELMFSACSVFINPFPLELTSVSWIDI